MSEAATARRRPKGTVRERNGRQEVRIPLPDGTRSKWVRLPAGTTREQAQAAAEQMYEIAREEARAEKAPPESTWDGWAERWFAYRRERGHTSVRQDEGRWRRWVSPAIGRLVMSETRPEHFRALVETLDKAQRAETIQPKTADLVWGVVTSAVREAMRSKRDGLRVLKASPIEHVAGPDAGPERETTWLYPVEAEALFRCSRVPLRWRQLVALAIGLYLRPGEMEVVGPRDVDLVAGVVTVHQAADPTAKGETKRTKTGTTRRVPIEPMVLPLLERLAVQARAEGRERLVTLPPESDLAEGLRTYLRRAGCERAELYANDRARRPLRWRDLRNTGITWRALRGDHPSAIQRAAGHRRGETTDRYIKAGEDLGFGVGVPFPALPPELLDVGSFSDPRALCDAETALKQGSMLASPAGFEATAAPPARDGDSTNPQFWTPFGALDAFDAHRLAAAVSESDPRDRPAADLVGQAREAAAGALAAFERGDVAEARRCWRDLGLLLRFGERRRGAPRYVTDPRTGRTQTVSAWARELGRTSQGLTSRLDTMPVERALVPAKGRAA